MLDFLFFKLEEAGKKCDLSGDGQKVLHIAIFFSDNGLEFRYFILV